jgi:hypothetical protein
VVYFATEMDRRMPTAALALSLCQKNPEGRGRMKERRKKEGLEIKYEPKRTYFQFGHPPFHGAASQLYKSACNSAACNICNMQHAACNFSICNFLEGPN